MAPPGWNHGSLFEGYGNGFKKLNYFALTLSRSFCMFHIPVSPILELKQLTTPDAPELFKLVQGSRRHLRKWLPWVDSNTREEHSLEFIRIMEQRCQDLQAIAFGIRREGLLCGVLDLHGWDKELGKAEMGYWLAENFQGRGIMVQCCEALLEFCFQQLQLLKVEIRFVLQNERSASVPVRLGFCREGILRQSARLHGQMVDMVVMGLLKKDWKLRRVEEASFSLLREEWRISR
ncbi:MAG: GNAT family N-acetyltransferase [Chitinophagaceae bacterium]